MSILSYRRFSMKFEKNKTYLRIRPIINGLGEVDFSFCSDPIKYLFEHNGDHYFCYPKGTYKGDVLGTGTRLLPTAFRDPYWESVSDIMDGDDWAALDLFSGKKIYRKKPLKISDSLEELSFNFSFDVAGIDTIKYDKRFVGPNNAVTVLAATKYHVVVEKNGYTIFLDCRYTNPEDWAVLEDE